MKGSLGVEDTENRVEDSKVSFLLIHGFSGTPLEMKSLGDFLRENGISSFAVRIAGHGTTPEDLAVNDEAAWYGSVSAGLDHVLGWGAEHVFVAGVSMGSLLAFDLAIRRGEDLSGVVAISPAIKFGGILGKLVPFIRRVKKYRRIDLSYIAELYDLPRPRYDREPLIAIERLIRYAKRIRRELSKVRVPTLILQAAADTTVDPRGAEIAFKKISSEVKELHFIEGAPHVLTCHPAREQAYELLLRFVRRVTGEGQE